MKIKLQENLIWIDLEMTGLNTDTDSILEIATIVTDAQLNELAEGPVFAINHPESSLRAMDDWNQKHHSESGLWGRVLSSTCSLAQAEEETMAFLEKWTEKRRSPMCGNSICQDRRFMHRQMPALEKWFHYRNLDVSTLKELAVRWAHPTIPAYAKKGKHEALSDVRESIEELRHYRRYMGQLSGLNNDQ